MAKKQAQTFSLQFLEDRGVETASVREVDVVGSAQKLAKDNFEC
jgi:hypothetical protein